MEFTVIHSGKMLISGNMTSANGESVSLSAKPVKTPTVIIPADFPASISWTLSPTIKTSEGETLNFEHKARHIPGFGLEP